MQMLKNQAKIHVSLSRQSNNTIKKDSNKVSSQDVTYDAYTPTMKLNLNMQQPPQFYEPDVIKTKIHNDYQRQISNSSGQKTTVSHRFGDTQQTTSFRKSQNFLSANGQKLGGQNFAGSSAMTRSHYESESNNSTAGKNQKGYKFETDDESQYKNAELQQQKLKDIQNQKQRSQLSKKFKEQIPEEEFKDKNFMKIEDSELSSQLEVHSKNFDQRTTNFAESQLDYRYSSNYPLQSDDRGSRGLKAKSAMATQKQLNAVRVHPRFRKTVQFNQEEKEFDESTLYQRPNSDMHFQQSSHRTNPRSGQHPSSHGSFNRGLPQYIKDQMGLEENTFQHMHYPLDVLYKFYFEGGNLISENSNNTVEVEYLDGSKFIGEYTDNLRKGEYTKKSKNNHSYYQGFIGEFNESIPHGKDGEIDIKLSNWPKYHPLMSHRKYCLIKTKAKRESLKFRGNIIDGTLDGSCEVILNNKLRYKTLFQNGLEIPQSKALKDISTDRVLISFALFIGIVACLIIGACIDMQGYYAAAALYGIQFMEYCCSNTKNLIGNIESLDQIRNLLIEYQKWRPVLFLHYRFSEENEKKKKQESVSNNTIKTIPLDSQKQKPFDNENQSKTPTNLNSSLIINQSDLQNSRNMSIDMHSLMNAYEENDKDLIEEFNYLSWQDLSPEVNTFDMFKENHKFIKLNIYKLFDFTTFAQWQLNKRKKAFAQYVFSQIQLRKLKQVYSEGKEAQNSLVLDKAEENKNQGDIIQEYSIQALEQNLSNKGLKSKKTSLNLKDQLPFLKDHASGPVSVSDQLLSPNFKDGQSSTRSKKSNNITIPIPDLNIDEDDLLKSIKVRKYLEGNTKDDVMVSIEAPPSWFNKTFYFMMSIVCLGWIIRLYLYKNTVCVNYYLKKIIVK